MTLLDAEFVNRCEGIRRAAARRSGRRFLGRKIRKTIAGGTEVTDHRDYSTGDDYRYVDWNRAARLDELVSKQYHGREDEDLYLMIDSSASMKLASAAGITKFDYARQLAAAIGYLALGHLDHVRACTCSGAGPHDSLRIYRKHNIGLLLDFLNGLAADGPATDLSAGIEQFVTKKYRPGMVVLVSDLLDPAGFTRPLELLRDYHFEPFIVHLLASADAEPGAVGKVAFHDVEAGGKRRLFIDQNDLANYLEVFNEFCHSVDNYCRRRRIGMIRITTDVPVELAVEQMLRFGGTSSA